MRFAIVLSTLLLASTHALANCAEDLTRVQLAMPNATPDIQASLRDIVNQAVNRAKAQDGAGCESATVLGLQLLGLPKLQPVELSTPLAIPQSGSVNQPPNKPSDNSTSTSSSSAPSSKPPSNAQAAAAPAAGQTPTRPAADPAQPPAPAADAMARNEMAKGFYFSTRDLAGTSVKEAQNQNRILASSRALLSILKRPQSLMHLSIRVAYSVLMPAMLRFRFRRCGFLASGMRRQSTSQRSALRWLRRYQMPNLRHR